MISRKNSGVEILNNVGQYGKKTCSACSKEIDDHAVVIYAFRSRGLMSAQSAWIHKSCLDTCVVDSSKSRMRCIICNTGKTTHKLESNNSNHRNFGLHIECLEDVPTVLVPDDQIDKLTSKREKGRKLRKKNNTIRHTYVQLGPLLNPIRPRSYSYGALKIRFRHADGLLVSMNLVIPKDVESCSWNSQQMIIIFYRRCWRWGVEDRSTWKTKVGPKESRDNIHSRLDQLLYDGLLSECDHETIMTYLSMFNEKGALNCEDAEHKMFHVIGQPCPCYKELERRL